MKYLAYNIEWGEKIDDDQPETPTLPSSCIVDDINTYPEDIAVAIINFLSEKFGYYVYSIDYDEYDAYIGRIARQYVEAREEGKTGGTLHTLYSELRKAVREEVA